MRLRVVLALLLTLVARVADAQSWRMIEVSRQLRDSAAHHVRVDYGAGRFDLRAANEPVLYSMKLRYDESNGRPLHSYDSEQRSLRLGIADGSFRGSFNRDNQGELRLTLARSVPMDLDLDLGATKARIDLGGLALRGLHLGSGASETEVDFSEPNPIRLRTIEIEVGAAALQVRNLGNANASTLRVHGGVGSVTLDFGGQWSQDMTVDTDLSLGKLHLKVPHDVGVRVEVDRVLASFDHGGLVKRDGAYYSANWETATYRLRIHSQTVFGAIDFDQTASR
jgi:hypothetical protein